MLSKLDKNDQVKLFRYLLESKFKWASFFLSLSIFRSTIILSFSQINSKSSTLLPEIKPLRSEKFRIAEPKISQLKRLVKLKYRTIITAWQLFSYRYLHFLKKSVRKNVIHHVHIFGVFLLSYQNEILQKLITYFKKEEKQCGMNKLDERESFYVGMDHCSVKYR